MQEPIRILHVLGALELGGAESRIMDLYRNMNRKEVQFDFMVHSNKRGFFEDEIEKLGGNIYRVPRFRFYNIFSYKKAWREFFKKHTELKAVQGHMTSTAAIYLPIAKQAGIPMTIAHARSAGTDPGLKGKLTRFLRRNLSQKTDYMLSCSKEAAVAVFGEESVTKENVWIIPNAIMLEQFQYDPIMREKVRKNLGINDKFVVGHVGRFHYAKNHEFLLQVFKIIHEKRSDAILLLLGSGSLMEECKKQAVQLGIDDNVIFNGNVSNVSDYYQAMDYLVFPSRYEGMPGTIVEAQATGLPCLISDTITKEVIATELVTAKSLQNSYEDWANKVLMENSEHPSERKDEINKLREDGFDVKEQAKILTAFYKGEGQK